MNFKETFLNIFSYNPKQPEPFLIPNSPNNVNENESQKQTVSTNIEENKKYITSKYNLLINSDINLHEFEINISSKKLKSFILFVDGLVDNDSINDFILSPLQLRNTIKMNPFNNHAKLQNVQKFDLQNYLLKNLISQNNIKPEQKFEKIFEKVNSGFCALFVDTLDTALCIETKDITGRSISEPQNENVVRGSHEAFVENIRPNTSLIRKIINNENLVIEDLSLRKNNKNIYCCLLYEKYCK